MIVPAPWAVVTSPPCPLRSRRPLRLRRRRRRPRRPRQQSFYRRRQPRPLRSHPCGLRRSLQRVAKWDNGPDSAAACTESPVQICTSRGTTVESSWSMSPNSTRAPRRGSGPVPPLPLLRSPSGTNFWPRASRRIRAPAEQHQYAEPCDARSSEVAEGVGAGRSLLCSRWDLDPRLAAPRDARIVGPRAGAVVPVRLWESRLLNVHGRLLHDDRRRCVAVVGRVIPPVPVRAPAAPRADDDNAVAPEPVMEPVVMTEPVAAVPAVAPCIAW